MTPLERRLLDEVEIHRLAASYSHAVMRLDGEAAASVYTADGVLIAFHKPEIRGRVAISEALTATLGQLEFLTQTCAAGIIDVAGDAATASWTVTELLKRPDEDALACCFGSYEDHLVRTGEGWRFARRRFQPFYRGGVSGEGRFYRAPDFERSLQPWPPEQIS